MGQECPYNIGAVEFPRNFGARELVSKEVERVCNLEGILEGSAARDLEGL